MEGTVKLRTRHGQIEKLALVITMGDGEWCGGWGMRGGKEIEEGKAEGKARYVGRKGSEGNSILELLLIYGILQVIPIWNYF